MIYRLLYEKQTQSDIAREQFIINFFPEENSNMKGRRMYKPYNTYIHNENSLGFQHPIRAFKPFYLSFDFNLHSQITDRNKIQHHS